MPNAPISRRNIFRSEIPVNMVIVFIALIITQSAGLAWSASYHLYLENGNILRTPHYWEEGEEIKFYIHGGVVGIPKGFVSRVAISNVDYKEEVTTGNDMEKVRFPVVISSQKPKETIQIQTSERDSKPSGNTETETVTDFNYYRERKAALKEKLEEALQRNRDATARKDQQAKDSTRKEYLEFSRQIIDLGDQLKRRNMGELPDWWEE